MKSLNLAQALKHKNRLAGEIARAREIVQRENSRKESRPGYRVWPLIVGSGHFGRGRRKIFELPAGSFWPINPKFNYQRPGPVRSVSSSGSSERCTFDRIQAQFRNLKSKSDRRSILMQ